MTTSAMHGAFRANLATRQEFLENIARPRVEGFI